MKNSTKILLGVGATAVVGTTIAVLVSEKVSTAMKEGRNRRLIKQFVVNNLHSNPKVLDVVEDLSGDEINTVANVLTKIQAGKNRISVTGKTVKEATEEAKKMLLNLIEDLI